jgi:hypothetical protein
VETELAQYKKIVAEQTLQITALKYVIKKALWPAEKRELVEHSHKEYRKSLRLAFKLFDFHPSVYYYQVKEKTDDQDFSKHT